MATAPNEFGQGVVRLAYSGSVPQASAAAASESSTVPAGSHPGAPEGWPELTEGPLRTAVAALGLFGEIRPAALRLVHRWCAAGGDHDHASFVSALLGARLLRRGDTDRFVIAGRGRATVERELADPEDARAIRASLIDTWLAAPDLDLLDPLAGWAADLGRWDAMESLWILLAERTDGIDAATLDHFASLPEEARRAHPILTWASGAAASLLGNDPPRGPGELWNRLMHDSAMLHSDWAVREDTDAAVTAGTFRMIGERRMTAPRGDSELDAAWRTRDAIDHLIDARARAGAGPTRRPQAVFRAFSARLSLFRGDPHAAVNEARWSTVLADWEPLAVMARGVEALATAIATEDGPAHYSSPPVVAVCGGLGARGLRGMGEVYELLADGYEAIRRLDRVSVDQCLAAVTTEAATAAGVWAVRVSLAAWRTALWGDLSTGVAELSEEIARLSIRGREHAEPMGANLLGRAQAFLLAKSGALVSAAEVADTLPEPVRLVSTARVHLWAGRYHDAGRLADLGPHKPGLEIVQRYRLASIRIAATILEAGPTPEVRREVAREVARLIRTGSFLYLALLPLAVRRLILEVAEEELGTDDPGLALLGQRLSGLNDQDGGATRPLRLTERELVLLPLLATSDPVPVIARKLSVSPNTVRKQVVTLREKFAASTRGEMIRRARTAGLLD